MSVQLPIGATKAEQIAHILEQEMRQGALSNGDLLASESELMARFSVSRNTIRKSLTLLAKKDLITTKRGIGSFVTYGGEVIDSRSGWSLALETGGPQIATRVLRLEQGTMDIESQTIAPGTPCLIVDRLRFLVTTGRGISLERSRLPWRDAYAALPETGLADGSLSETFRQLGLSSASGREKAGVLPALSDEDARLMGRAAGEPMLRLRRHTLCSDGSTLEFVESILDPLRFALQIEF